MKLNKLFIQKFRGATQPLTIEFDSAKKITMLFGENGMGKSSIADALICLCTDKLGSISDKSSIDKGFIKTLNCINTDVVISLSTDKGTFSAKLNTTGSYFVKTPNEELPAVRHLRRSQIIGLIDSEPSKRYEALKDYIDVAGIIKSEDELRKACRSSANNLSAIKNAIQNAEATLSKSWEAEGRPYSSYEDWAKLEAEKDVSEQQKLCAAFTEVVNLWSSVENKRKEVSKAAQQFKINVTNETDLLGKVKELEAKNSQLDATLLTVLVEAEKFINSKIEIDVCPVCERPEDRSVLKKQIILRIESMKEFQTAQSNYKSAKLIKDNSESVLKTLIKSFIEELELFNIKLVPYTEADESELADAIKEVYNAVTNNDKYQAVKKNITFFIDKVSLLKIEADKIQKSINQHNLISQHYRASVTNKNNLIDAANLATATAQALEIVEKTRKEFIEEELSSISENVERLYQQMHPNEQLGGIRLFLKAGAKNSLELNANFYSSTAVTPQSLYSESHLDTLGICIFIALAKKYNNGNTILILDDVVMSVDENHLDKFIDLLHDEASSFAHILITTHYRPWKDRYRHSRAPSHQVHFVELRKWDLATGIRLQNSKIDIEELRIAIDSPYFDRQRISNLAGTILENALDFLSVKYQCKIARKVRQDYVLSELLNCLSSKLLKVMKVQHLQTDESGAYVDSSQLTEIELKPIIEELKQLSAVRNQVGSHYNFDGSMVSDGDVEDFGNKVYEFAQLLICPKNGSFPDKNKSGSYHETRSGSIRLFPFVEPA